MNTTDEFAKILRDVFSTGAKWTEWFMRSVFRRDELYFTENNGHIVSMLLRTPYSMDFHSQTVRCDYISCVATVPSMRGNGLMSGLMFKALDDVRRSDVPFVCLIPSEPHIYFIYDRFGFATVFYISERRYTSAHKFAAEGYHPLKPTYSMFSRLESLRKGSILHSAENFDRIIEDIEIDGGVVVAVSDGAGSEAMVFANIGEEIKVTDILSTDTHASEAALAAVRGFGCEKPMLVWEHPDECDKNLHPRGMIRIANVVAALGAVAAAAPNVKMKIKVTDGILQENTGTYFLNNGKCTKIDESDEACRDADLDVSVDVLAEILFSSERVGRLFGIPAERPFISLMLD